MLQNLNYHSHIPSKCKTSRRKEIESMAAGPNSSIKNFSLVTFTLTKGLELFGKNWKKISDFVGTRTGSQIRSHAQKFFMKMNNKKKDEQNSQMQSDENVEAISFRSKQNLNIELAVEKIQPLGDPFFWNKMYKINKENKQFSLWDYIDQEGRRGREMEGIKEIKGNSFKVCAETEDHCLRDIQLNVNTEQ